MNMMSTQRMAMRVKMRSQLMGPRGTLRGGRGGRRAGGCLGDGSFALRSNPCRTPSSPMGEFLCLREACCGLETPVRWPLPPPPRGQAPRVPQSRKSSCLVDNSSCLRDKNITCRLHQRSRRPVRGSSSRRRTSSPGGRPPGPRSSPFGPVPSEKYLRGFGGIRGDLREYERV